MPNHSTFKAIVIPLLIYSLVNIASICGYATCGTPYNDDVNFPDAIAFIAGGNKANANEFPYMASVRLKQEPPQPDKHICGGTLIQDNVVLTAAHCLFKVQPRTRFSNKMIRVPFDKDDLFIMTGTSSLSNPLHRGGVNRVSEIIIHEDYSLTNAYPENHDHIRPACVASRGYMAALTRTRATPVHCIVMGWGADPFNSDDPNQLKHLDLRLTRNADCARSWNQFDTERMLCGGVADRGYKAEGPCSGDSGGPLVCSNDAHSFVIESILILNNLKLNIMRRYYVVGVVSWGHMLCMIKPAVFTHVGYYYSWLRQKLKLIRGINFPLYPPVIPTTTEVPTTGKPAIPSRLSINVQPGGRGVLASSTADRIARCKLDNGKYVITANYGLMDHDLEAPAGADITTFKGCYETCCEMGDICGGFNWIKRTTQCQLTRLSLCDVIPSAKRKHLRVMYGWAMSKKRCNLEKFQKFLQENNALRGG